jgi:hypothetical protein
LDKKKLSHIGMAEHKKGCAKHIQRVWKIFEKTAQLPALFSVTVLCDKAHIQTNRFFLLIKTVQRLI